MLKFYSEEPAPWHVIALLAMLTFAGEMLGNENFSCNPLPHVDREECVDLCSGFVKAWSPKNCECMEVEE